MIKLDRDNWLDLEQIGAVSTYNSPLYSNLIVTIRSKEGNILYDGEMGNKSWKKIKQFLDQRD